MPYDPEAARDVEQEEETVKGKHGGRRLSWHLLVRWWKSIMWWKSIITMSSVLSVSVDPLFLYIPITNEDMKCLRLDQNLKTVTLLLRSVVDLPCMVQIISQILAARSCFLIDILAILPIPQVVILIFLTRTRGSKSLNERKFLNSLILVQYFPRIFRMYLSCKANKEEANNACYGDNGHRIWLRVYKFILACHVFGAFWYFFSIQREMDCWQYACRRENKCEAYTFECGGNHTFKNVTFLNDLCPISTPDPTLFDFGIFLDALQSDILRSTDFPRKFLHCFWWGLRSLSSLGQNLQTSTYAWENLFALGISVVGIILFLIYLSAILQFANSTSQRHEREMISTEGDLSASTKSASAHSVADDIVENRRSASAHSVVDDIVESCRPATVMEKKAKAAKDDEVENAKADESIDRFNSVADDIVESRRSASANSVADDIVESRRPATVMEKKAKAAKEFIDSDEEENAKADEFIDSDEEVNAKADEFIGRFKQQLKLQRLDQVLRYRNHFINRGSEKPSTDCV